MIADDTIELRLPEISSGALTVELSYSGKFDEQLDGLYRVAELRGGTTEYSAFTQFEATSFRKAVPGIDEPQAKAQFELTIEAPAGKTVLSNMPAAAREERGGRQRVRFERTPKMATYLLALAVGRFASKSVQHGKVAISIWSAPEKLAETDFALDKAARALDYFEKKTAVAFPLPKLDLLLVPEFSAGAMENWGLITFRDRDLLVHPTLSSVETRKRVANTVAHEISHMWWGNLVTMTWWDGLFLNESNAALMGYAFAADDEPAWDYWVDYRRDTLRALETDGYLRGAHSIILPVDTTAEIDAMFDVLTYEKGAAVLRMLENYLTPEVYWQGVRAYLRAHSYANARPQDFWSALETASGGKVPVRELAHDWFEQEGYPLITVDAVGPAGVKLSQRRFLYWGSGGGLWRVPVVLRYSRGGRTYETRRLLDAKETLVPLEGSGPVDWIYPNGDQAGYYRVQFSTALLANAIAELPRLRTVERIGMLADLGAQALAGGSIEPLIGALVALRNDSNRFVIEEISGFVTLFRRRLAPNPAAKAAVDAFAQRQLAAHWSRVGWSGGSEEDRLARAALLEAYGPADPAVAKEALRRLDRYLDDPAALEPELVEALLGLAVRLAPSQALFSRLTQALAAAKTGDAKDALVRHGFGGFSDPALVDRFLDETLKVGRPGRGLIQKQDAAYAVSFMLESEQSQRAAWSWVKRHFSSLKALIGNHSAEKIVGETDELWFPEASKELGEFFARPENRVDSAAHVLAHAQEATAAGARFVAKQSGALTAALDRAP